MNLTRQTLLTSGNILIKAGLKMISSSFQLNPQMATGEELVRWLQGKFPGIRVSMKDLKCYLIDIETWKEFIKYDWTKEKKYIIDRFDCDNFSDTFAAHASEMLDITVFKVWGQVTNKNTGKRIGYHYWNAMITAEKDGEIERKCLFFYEPQTGTMVEYLGQKIVMDEMIYFPEQFIIS